MAVDDEILKPKFVEWPPKELDSMSIDALTAYREQLEAELDRVRQTIDTKRDYLGSADALFKKQ
jgi:hypothetical protein